MWKKILCVALCCLLQLANGEVFKVFTKLEDSYIERENVLNFELTEDKKLKLNFSPSKQSVFDDVASLKDGEYSVKIENEQGVSFITSVTLDNTSDNQIGEIWEIYLTKVRFYCTQWTSFN